MWTLLSTSTIFFVFVFLFLCLTGHNMFIYTIDEHLDMLGWENNRSIDIVCIIDVQFSICSAYSMHCVFCSTVRLETELGVKFLWKIRFPHCLCERNPFLSLSKTLNLPQQSHQQHTLWTIQFDRMDPLGFMKKTS